MGERSWLERMRVPSRVRAQAMSVARDLRKQPTQAEWLLWTALRGSRLGVRFRRQQWIRPYVVDFYSSELRLVIEVDGPHHANQREHDDERQRQLEQLGLRFIRVTTAEVERELPATVERLMQTISTLRSPT